MYDTALEAKNLGIGSVMISNGFIQEKALRELMPRLSAIKIDFKGFTETFYKDICKGELKPVLRSLEIIKEMKTWLEIVLLVIPTLNDGIQENKDMAKWIIDHLGADVPVHITRFHPMYKLKNVDSTPVKTLERIHEDMKQTGLHYVYIGNVPGHKTENTFCPACQTMLIERVGYTTAITGMKEDKCGRCGTQIPGVWKNPCK